MTNRDVLDWMNRKNGVSSAERQKVEALFRESGYRPLQRVFDQYHASMNQDLTGWQRQKPQAPEIVFGPLPSRIDFEARLAGIGGLFASMNIVYQAFKHGGRHCIVTHPHDIWTFSAWTLHPEEDMDMRMVSMFRTLELAVTEARRMTGLAKPPSDPGYRAFRIDYRALFAMMVENPAELAKFLGVNARYVGGEWLGGGRRHARTNLARNGATLEMLRRMKRRGSRTDRDFVNPTGRVVFEPADEPTLASKAETAKRYGLVGRTLSAAEVRDRFGDEIPILADVRKGLVDAVFYPGGYFHAGFRENLLEAAEAHGARVFDAAVARRIVIDRGAGRAAVTFTDSDGKIRCVGAERVLLAAGAYDRKIVPVDGVSALCVICTRRPDYRFRAAGLGQGGTVHLVPAHSAREEVGGVRRYFHLIKATNGAIVGRDPKSPKHLFGDRDMFTHMDHAIAQVAPPDAKRIYLAATECGRPVVSDQGYRIRPLAPSGLKFRSGSWSSAVGFEAGGGCGLGGNTAVIPEIQAILDRQAAAGR